MDLTLFVAGSALFDSLATAQQIVFLVLLFSTDRPLRASAGFLVGLGGAYLVCGLVGLALVDKLNALVALFVPNLNAVGDSEYYRTEVVLGIVLVIAGPLYWLYKKRHPKPLLGSQFMARLKGMGFWAAFGLGALLSSTSFPAALPYVAALEKIAAADLSLPAAWAFVLLYNGVYLIPLLIPFGLFAVLREAVVPRLHLHAEAFNRVITIVLLSGMGLFLAADGAAYFWTGTPLLATRFI